MSYATRAAFLGATAPAAIAALLATPAFAATTYKYTTIAFPGATQTSVTGINASKVVSGTYTDASGNQHAFTWAAGKYTNIASPTGSSINAVGINDADSVTGTYIDSNGFTVGYIANKSAFTTIAVGAQNVIAGAINSKGQVALSEESYFNQVNDFTYLNGATQTYFTIQYNATPTGINTAGAIIGNYTNNGGQQVSYLFANGTSITLPATGSLSMSANAINTAGVVVGAYVSSATNTTVGFTYSNGVMTTTVEPGFTNTSLSGIDTAGDVIGTAWNTGGATGFMLSKGVFSQVTPPGATSVSLTGINSKGVICGNAASATGTKGFIATP